METLDARRLNRALLERQLLLERSDRSVPEAVDHLVGLQAQNVGSPYLALQARLAGFDPAALAELLVDRRAVRIVVMRSTIHLVLADDCLVLRPLTEPVTVRGLQGSWGRYLVDLDLAAVAAAGRSLVEERPRTSKELGEELAARWPDRDPAALAQVVRAFVPLVQLPPRGVWGQSGVPVLTSAESWLGRAMAAEPSVADVALRYLAAFGPAKAADFRSWSGLTGAREVLDGLDLRRFRDEGGAELYDVPDGPLPDRDVPAPVRYLPDYDNVLLGHDDRSRILREDLRSGLIGVATVLVDGFVAGTWRVERAKGSATVVVTPFGRVDRTARLELVEEGVRVLAMTDPDATPDVRIEAAGRRLRSPAGPEARSPGGRSRAAERRS
ncbi:MAG: Winged helix DNA-binding protein [Actinomycetia bacterium]|nr:Winged helix DNA-binding protein [Actinomycetes bacterium]